MSFGSNTGFGFGQSNNQSSGTGFGAFGSNNATNTGFGTSTSTSGTGFGSTTASSNPFSASGFGSNTGGGFGSTNNTTSLFGQNKPAFGSTNTSSAPSLFGNNTTSTGFGATSGGFGSNASTGFGSANNNTGSGFSFGSQTNKPAFGSNTGSTLFGQGGSGTTGGFGSTSNAFGAASGTALNQAVPASEGTGATPFQPTNEKEPNGGNISYQSISFQQPYQKYSFEELRLADYTAGRRFGSGSGFGTSTFGGFGASSNTGFGTSNSNPFGGTSSSSTPFGSTQTSGLSSGNLFGNKPTTSLFGSQSTSTSTGGLFGTSNAATTGFGGSSSTGFGSNNTTSLFGNNQNQNKPGGNLFGNTGSNTSTGFGFSSNPSTTSNTNPFGGSSGGNLFGNNTQTQGSGIFGQNQGPNQQKPPFGSTFGTNTTQSQPSTGLFGSTGSTNTNTGLFGSNSGTQPQGGLFGGGGSNQTSNLFGGNSSMAQKPLFGSSSTNTGPGLFGNTQSQPTTTNLFGNANQQQNQPQQGPSLFGGNNNTNTGLFGNSNANKPGTLFSNSATSANQGPSLFGNNNSNTTNTGLFGGSQSTQNTPQQQPSSLHASLLDGNPYGQSSIWTGLPSATPQNSGPLATPLTASQRLKESQVKPPPSLRFTGSRYITPPRRQGYGLTYSPSSSAGSTPGGGSLSTSMYGRAFTGGSFGKVVGKSFSASNLRQQFSIDGESVLSPGAFAPGSSRYSSGSIRRLTIDKNVKVDLFGRSTPPALPAPASVKDAPPTNGETAPAEQQSKLKKRVSFDKDIMGGETNGHLNGETGALVRTETDEQDPPAEDARFPRSARRTTNSNGSSSAPPEMEHVRGNELAVVPEDRESDNVVSKMRLPTDANPIPDPKPGDYWMKPSRAEISKMPREKLQNFRGFQVGRHGCGSVTFDGPVDLTTIPLDDVFEKLADIELRSITVYPEASTKPPRGKGLNVPSTLQLENSWPRNRKTNAPSSATSGPLFEKHIKRLRNTTNTEFVGYDVQSGVWTFRVPHFTRYGLDYDDDDGDESGLSSLPETPIEPTPRLASPTASAMEVDVTPDNSSPEDDTFAFRQKIVPGGFDRQSVVDNDQGQFLLGDGPAAAMSRSERSYISEQEESDDEMNMAGSFPHNDGAAAQGAESPMRTSLAVGHQPWGTPGRPLIDLDGDWAEQLQRTISPRKQNREALREVQRNVLLNRSQQLAKRSQSSNKNEFRTSIDVMNSLFGKHEERMALSRMQESGGSSFEWPYPKRAKTLESAPTDMDTSNQSMKPKWTPTGHLLYAQSGPPNATRTTSEWQDVQLVVGEDRDVVESVLQVADKDPYLDDDMAWRKSAQISIIDGIPVAKHKNVPFSTFCDRMTENKNGNMVAPGGEREVYQLAHVLFDEYEDEFSAGLTAQQKKQFAYRIRKDRLTDCWDLLVGRRHYKDIAEAEKRSLEEAALWYLTVHDVTGACNCLIKAKDYHLATLVAQIDQADKVFQEDIKSQIEAWREQSIIPEMSEPIRALYEILAGNTTISKGKSDGPVEDRASTFTISERFGFDWMQAFALCLWYGEHKHGPIEDAVREFAGKLDDRLESAYPHPDNPQQASADEQTNFPAAERNQESPLWVLLKLYAARTGARLEQPVLPQALAPLTKPFDARAAFQLHHSLAAHIPYLSVDTACSDVLAVDLAFQLSAAGFSIGAIYALLHLSNPTERKAAIKDLLTRHAADIPDATSATSADLSNIDSARAKWHLLTEELRIPSQWICEAKALFARSQDESHNELNYLVAAELWSQAHACLCRTVAPRAVIDRDWVMLREILGKFGEKPEERVGESWRAGGGIYADFVRLVTPVVKEKGKKGNGSEGHISAALIHRLQAALTEMGARLKKRGAELMAGGRKELEEMVACKEMGRLVAEATVADNGVPKKTILDLPLTADARLSQTRELSVGYYRAAMAAAR